MPESAMEPQKLTHFFYHMMIHVSAESSHPPNIPLFYVGQLLIVLYATVRLSFLSFIIRLRPTPLWYLPYDAPASAWLHPTAPLDSTLLPINLIMELFIFYLYFLIYRQSPTSYSIRWFKEIVVQFQDKSRDALLSLEGRNQVLKETVDSWDAWLVDKIQEKIPFFSKRFLQPCTHLIARLCAKAQIWLSLAYYSRKRLYRAPLSVQPNLSRALRRLLLLSLQAVEWVGLASQVITFFAVNQFLLNTYLRVRESLTWTAPLSALLDILTTHYQFYQLLNLAFFFTLCTLISVLVNMGHCRAICQQLQSTLSKQRMRPNSKRCSSSRLLSRQFSLFLTDYYRCIGLATYGNGQLFSRVLFAFFLTNVPVNIYFITQIVFNSKKTSMLILSIVISGFQAVALYAVLGPLAFFCAEMHRPTKILPVVQLQLGSSYLLSKLKLDNLLFRLLSHAPITISVGPLSAVTLRFIFEFLTMYAGYLLMAFSMQMKAQQKET